MQTPHSWNGTRTFLQEDKFCRTNKNAQEKVDYSSFISDRLTAEALSFLIFAINQWYPSYMNINSLQLDLNSVCYNLRLTTLEDNQFDKTNSELRSHPNQPPQVLKGLKK